MYKRQVILQPIIADVVVIDVAANVFTVGKVLFTGVGGGGTFGKSVFCLEQLIKTEDNAINKKK